MIERSNLTHTKKSAFSIKRNIFFIHVSNNSYNLLYINFSKDEVANSYVLNNFIF
jgi:hypothetical protein